MTQREKKSNKFYLTQSSEHLNKPILDYYYKFGQNRDLEKYLRLNRKKNKSSSEGSISGLSCKNSTKSNSKKNFGKGQSKSLDNFDDSVSSENAFDEGHDNKELEKSVCDLSTDIKSNLKVSSICVENESQNQSFEYGSQLQLPIQPNYFPRNNLVDTCETKTDESVEIEDPLTRDNNISTDKRQEDVEEKQHTPDTNKKSAKILEWDSLGDVGYNRSFANRNLNKSMSTIERSVLKGFFAERGIEISFPKCKVNENDKQVTKESWRVTLENVKKKYNSSPNLLKRNSVDLSKEQFKKPVLKYGVSESSSNCYTRNNKIQQKDVARQNIEKKFSNIETELLKQEKYCQTSIIGKEDQLIQCNFSTVSSSVMEDQSDTTHSSFMYVPQELEKQNDSETRSSSKESSTIKTFLDRKSELKDSLSKFIEKEYDKKVCKNSRDIDLGISLLCSLIESKNFNNREKKKLAKKIINKITNNNVSSTDNSAEEYSKCGISGIESLTSSSSASNKITSRKASIENETQLIITKKNWNENSEDVEIQCDKKGFISVNRKPTLQDQKLKEIVKLKTKQDNENHPVQMSTKPTQVSKPICKKGIDVNLCDTMKELFEPLTNAELAYDKKNKESKENSTHSNKNSSRKENNEKSTKINKEEDNQKEVHINWIENEIKRLENLKNLLTIKNSSKEHSKRVENDHNLKYYEVGKKQCKTNLGKEYYLSIESAQLDQNSIANNKKHRSHIYDKIHSASNEETNRICKSSLENIQYSTSEPHITRLKLKTPPKESFDNDSSDSIRTFVKNKKREFIENYKIAHADRRLYDKPMISDHYSEPGYKNIPIVNKDFIFTSKYRGNTSTSTTNNFISSESVSLPINSGNSSTSNTNLYNASVINGIGIQTSDSILETTPIFGNDYNINKLPRKTVRIYGAKGKSQQTQVKPETISYTIKVDKNKNTEIRNNENLSLKDHLQLNCPEFYHRASKRQEILKEMQKLRKEREVEIRNIVENTSINSINRKLSNVPPPPTKYIRVFTTKQMKAITKKKQKCLAEVVDKVEKQKKEKYRKGTKILTDVFNKRLQKQVHKGKLSLEHSLTII